LFRRAKGERIDPAEVQRYLWKQADLTNWNSFGGSQNHPVIAEAATGDFPWVADLARLEREEGIFGRELGAPGYYFYFPVAAKMVALRDARQAGAAADAEAIRLSLRAVWAYESLVALETSRTSTESNLSGQIMRGSGNAQHHTGLTVAVAGQRWRSHAYTDHDDHGTFLGWALDWSPRSMRGGTRLRSRGMWWANTVAVLLGTDSYRAPAAPEPFGLTAAERETLRRVVRGDVAAAREAVGWLAEFGVFRRVRMRLRRTALGAEVVNLFHVNGNKPAHAATSLTREGLWRTIRPAHYRGVGANKGYSVRIEGGLIIANAADGVRVEQPELGGELLWEVDCNGRVVSFTTQGGTQTPAPPAPPAPPGPPTPPPSRPLPPVVGGPAFLDDARVVRHTIPSQIAPGQAVEVLVEMRNVGVATWTAAEGYRLGAVGDQSGQAVLFGRGRIELPQAAPVPTGATVTFRFTLRAPNQPGTYAPSWRMVHEQVRWFGQTLQASIVVR
jgi:hypothetical protein